MSKELRILLKEFRAGSDKFFIFFFIYRNNKFNQSGTVYFVSGYKTSDTCALYISFKRDAKVTETHVIETCRIDNLKFLTRIIYATCQSCTSLHVHLYRIKCICLIWYRCSRAGEQEACAGGSWPGSTDAYGTHSGLLLIYNGIAQNAASYIPPKVGQPA